jgi:hypothetical protein
VKQQQEEKNDDIVQQPCVYEQRNWNIFKTFAQMERLNLQTGVERTLHLHDPLLRTFFGLQIGS